MGEMTAEEVANEMLRCKLDAWNKIDEILNDMKKEAVRVDSLEASMASIKHSLLKHENQRTSFNNEMREEMTELKEWFRGHGADEMEKYNQILSAITSLTTKLSFVEHETDDNSKAIMQKRIEEEKQRAIQEALDKQKQPYIEYKKNAINSIIAIVVSAILYGLYKFTILIGELDKAIQ